MAAFLLLPFQFVLASDATNKDEAINKIILQTNIQLLKKPEDIQLSFTLGMAFKEKESYDKAVKIFKGILRVDPSLVRPRLELAWVLYQQEKYDESLYHFERVLSTKLPPVVFKNVQSFVSKIKAFKPSFYFQAFMVKDTNPNQTTSDEEIIINGLPFKLNQASSNEVDGVKLMLGAQIPIAYNGSLYTKINAEYTKYDVSTMDFGVAMISLGKSTLVEDTIYNIEVGTMASLYGGDSLYDGYVLKGSVRKPLSNKVVTSLTLDRSTFDYVKAYKGYDAVSYKAEFELSYFPTITDKLYSRIGLRNYNADYSLNSFDEKELLVGYRKEFKKGWRLESNVSLRQKDYQAIDPFFNSKRVDNIQSLNLVVTNDLIKLWEISPKLIFTKSKGESTHNLYDFERDTVMIGFGRVF